MESDNYFTYYFSIITFKNNFPLNVSLFIINTNMLYFPYQSIQNIFKFHLYFFPWPTVYLRVICNICVVSNTFWWLTFNTYILFCLVDSLELFQSFYILFSPGLSWSIHMCNLKECLFYFHMVEWSVYVN